MRNRGVEIYMNSTTEIDSLDLRSILFNLGLKESNYQEALIQMHNGVLEGAFVAQPPTLTHITHAAFLMIQQISRGFPIQDAFVNTCQEVYVKSRYVTDQHERSKLMAIIDTAVERLNRETGNDAVNLDVTTLSLRNLQESSKLTIIKQQGVLFNSLLESETTDVINNFLAPPHLSHVNTLSLPAESLLPHALLQFYEVSSKSDVELRKQWITQVLSARGNGDALIRKSEDVAREIINFYLDLNDTELPWDPMQLPGNYHVKRSEQVIRDVNALALLLYLKIALDAAVHEQTAISKDDTLVSVKQYSSALNEGEFFVHILKFCFLISASLAGLISIGWLKKRNFS